MSQLASKLNRYIKIPALFLRNSLMTQLEYRFEFSTWTVVSILWIVLMLVFVELLFGQVKMIAGWTKHEVLIVTALSGIFASLMQMFIIPSLWRLSENVRRGNLDFYLVKPIDSRFLVSVYQYDLDNITRVIFLICYLLFAIGLINISPGFYNLMGFLITYSLGLFLYYNLFFISATSTIWLVDLFNLDDFYSSLMNVGRFPVDIFKGGLNILFSYIVPAAFVATIPAKFLLGKGDPKQILWATILATTTFILSQWFWNFALKRYSSASS